MHKEGGALLVTLNQSVIHYKKTYSGRTCLLPSFFQPLYSPIYNLQPTIPSPPTPTHPGPAPMFATVCVEGGLAGLTSPAWLESAYIQPIVSVSTCITTYIGIIHLPLKSQSRAAPAARTTKGAPKETEVLNYQIWQCGSHATPPELGLWLNPSLEAFVL